MTNKKEKITLCFEEIDLLKKVVGDVAEANNNTFSASVENVIFDCLLPDNRGVRWVVRTYLYGENGSIAETMSAIFSNESAYDKHYDILPLVKFAKTQESYCSYAPITGTEERYPHACAQIQAVIDGLQYLSEEKNLEEKNYLERQVKHGEILLQELKEEPHFSRLINFYALLINNWKYVENWSVTYRMLCDLVELEKGWREDAEARIELLRLLKNLSVEW